MRRIITAVFFLVVFITVFFTPFSLAFEDTLWEGTLQGISLHITPGTMIVNDVIYPAAGEDFFVIGFNNHLLVYSLNGTLLWEKTFNSSIISYVGVHRKTIAVTVENYPKNTPYLYLFNVTSGSVIWKRKVIESGIPSSVSAYCFPDMIVVSVIPVNGSEGYIIAYDLQGNELWHLSVPDEGFPHQSTVDVKKLGNKIFLAEDYSSTLRFPDMELENHSSAVFILDKSSGSILHKVKFSGWYIRGIDTSKNHVIVALYTLKNESGLKEISKVVGLSYDGNIGWERNFQGSVAIDTDPSTEYVAVVVQNVTVDKFGVRTAVGSYTLLMSENGTIISRDSPTEFYNGKRYPLVQSAPVILPNTHLIFTETYFNVTEQVSYHYWWSGLKIAFGGGGSIGNPLMFNQIFRNIPPSPILSPNGKYLLYLAREGSHVKIKLVKAYGILIVAIPESSTLELKVDNQLEPHLTSPILYMGIPWGLHKLEIFNGSKVVYSTTISLKPDSYAWVFVPSEQPVKEIKYNETFLTLNGTKIEFNATTQVYRIKINGRPGYYIDHKIQINDVIGHPEALRVIFNVSKSIAHDVGDMILPPDTIIIQKEPVIAFDIKDPKEGEYSRGFSIVTNATPEEVVKGIIVEHVLITKSGEAKVSRKMAFNGESTNTAFSNKISTSPSFSPESEGTRNRNGSYLLIGVATAILLGAGFYLKGRK